MIEPERQPVLEHILAKLLMIEAVQANIIAHLAADTTTAPSIIHQVLSKAENELRVMALGEIDGSPAVARTADRALGYLAEYSANLRSLFHIPERRADGSGGSESLPPLDPGAEDLKPVG